MRRLSVVVLCVAGAALLAATGCSKRQQAAQVTPPTAEPPKAQVNSAPAGPIEVPEYPEPVSPEFIDPLRNGTGQAAPGMCGLVLTEPRGAE